MLSAINVKTIKCYKYQVLKIIKIVTTCSTTTFRNGARDGGAFTKRSKILYQIFKVGA